MGSASGQTPPPVGVPLSQTFPVEPVRMENGFPDSGGIFRSAWNTSARHIGDWVVTAVVAAFIAGLLVGIYALYNWTITDTERIGSFNYEVRNSVPFIELCLGVIAILAGSYIRYGFARTALATVRGQRAIFNDVWVPDRFLPMVVFDLVVGWMLLAGLALPFVGSLVVLGSCLYAPFFIIERKGSGVTAIWGSISMTTSAGRFLRQILFTVLGIAVLGSFVGAFWTILQLLVQSGIWDWSTVWRNLTLVLVGSMIFAVFVSSVVIAMTSAATAYVNLLREDEGVE